ncbi:MAG: hypothetical protein AB7N76_18845 [Planctomycetota bacterium]
MSDRDDLSALIDGELPPEEQAALEARLAEDPALAAELEELRGLVAQVRDLPKVDAPPDFAASIMSRVVPLAAARGAKAMHPDHHGAEGAKRRAEERARKRQQAKQQAAKQQAAKQQAGGKQQAGAAAAKPAGEQPRRRPRDPFAEDPFAALPPVDLEAIAEELGAYVDGELEPAERTRIEELAAREPLVEAELASLGALRQRVRALPRLEAPPSLLTKVLDEIDTLEREEARRVQEARQARFRVWQNVTRFAQAACFLLVVAGGMALTRPEDAPLGGGGGALGYRALPPSGGTSPLGRAANAFKASDGAPAPGAFSGAAAPNAEAGGADEQAKAGPAVTQIDERLGQRAYQATWELTAAVDLDRVEPVARGLLARFSRPLELEVRGDKDLGFVAHVSADQIDDLYAALAAASELGVPPAAGESLRQLHLEQDRVTLKNGFVLVGWVEERGDVVVVRAPGGRSQRLKRADVERIERANEVRCLRILIR